VSAHDDQHPGPDGGWHQPLRHVRAADLSADTGQTPGMNRTEAVSSRTVGSERVWMGQTAVGPRTASGNHHHGDSETAIYVVSGHPVFVFAEDDREVRLTPEPGDYLFVRRSCRTARRTRPTRRPWWSSRAAARRRSSSTCPAH